MNEEYIYLQELQAERQKYNSQAQMARAMGVHETSLSMYLNEKFTGDLEKFHRIVKNYFDRKQAREDMFAPDLLQLEITKKIGTTIDIAQNRKELCRIVGPNGIGKTLAVDYYLQRNPAAIKITANEAYRSTKAFLLQIWKATRRGEFKGTTDALFDEVEKRLKGYDTIIIVDQAHKLSQDAIGVCQAVYDATGVPFAFVGTSDMNEKLNRNGELISRLSVNRHLKLKPDTKDVQAICQQYGVYERELINMMKLKAQSGGLRIVSRTLAKARDLAPDNKIDYDAIKDSLEITEYHEPLED